MSYPVPDNEDERLAALHRLNILDTGAEAAFDRLADIARRVFGTENAAVTLVDANRQWFKAACGLDLAETPREQSFCAHVIDGPDVLVVEDARMDVRFDDNPFVVKEEGIRFYAGAPLTIEESAHVGTLCVSDPEPRPFDEEAKALLAELAEVGADLLRTRQQTYQTRYLTSALEQIGEAVLVTEAAPIDPPGPRITWVNKAFTDMTGYDKAELVGQTPRILQGPKTNRDTMDRIRTALEEETSVQAETVNYRKDGTPYIVSWVIAPVRDAEGTLTHWVSVQRDVTERRSREDALRYQADYDALTGLLGRSALVDQLQAALGAERDGALLFLDLDRFKQVNDSLGHNAGDELLCTVARRLEGAVRDDDVVARLGGDEFVVWLRSPQSTAQVVDVAERIQERIGAPATVKGQEVFVEASIGVVPSLAGYDDAEAALHDADAAMYASKAALAPSVKVFEPGMTEEAGEPLRLEAALRRGLERSEFEPFFMPTVDLAEGRLFGFEVLARWRREDELVSPGTFLEVAEKTGLIVPIGHQVIEKACATLHDLRSDDEQDLQVALSGNFSRREFFRPETRSFVKKMLDRYDVAPANFTMEITERAVGDHATGAGEEIQALRDLGIRMEIDDFGTGFSSFQSLLEFPVDGIKIDRGLTDELPDNERGVSLIRSVLDLARRLDLTATAEGIETPQQLAFLQSLGCGYGQGYLLSPPVPASQVRPMVSDPPWEAYWTGAAGEEAGAGA
ncbi:MAG: putative bifunctional diguanylate cyclase/phosphodiesterase [Salinivenus sp.]